MERQFRRAPLSWGLFFSVEGLDLPGGILHDLLAEHEIELADLDGEAAGEVLNLGAVLVPYGKLLHPLPFGNVASEAVVALDVLLGTLTRAGDAVDS